MKRLTLTILFTELLCLCSNVTAKSAQEWKDRVIYQLLTDRFHNPNSQQHCTGHGYCGGTFQGVIAKLDYLEALGVNAIWISPVVDQTDGGYHGYWAKNLNAINSHFGTEDDLKELVQKCHERDIWVMVDVVANHMGYPPGCPGCSYDEDNNFSSLSPFNQASHYHNYCQITDWGNQDQVETCRLADLPDLNQDNQFVRDTLKTWIKNLVQTYNFDGIRIDTIPEVKGDFWKEFGDAAGVYQVGEVDNGDPAYVGPYQNYLTATLNYPFYWTFQDVYKSKKSMKEITSRISQEGNYFKDMSVLGGFVDNHDNPRFLNNNNDWTTLKNALAYTLFAQWIPIVYYGTEQAYNGGNDPDNRNSLWPNFDTSHLMFQYISAINKFRKRLGHDFYESKQQEKWADDTFYAFTRGTNQEVLVATTNQGSGSDQQRTIPNLPYSEGQVLVNVADPSDKAYAHGGSVFVHISNGQPKIYTTMSMEGAASNKVNVTHDEVYGEVEVIQAEIDITEVVEEFTLQEDSESTVVMTTTTTGEITTTADSVATANGTNRRRRNKISDSITIVSLDAWRGALIGAACGASLIVITLLAYKCWQRRRLRLLETTHRYNSI